MTYPFDCFNPTELGAPLGPYSQALAVPLHSQLLLLSGQTPLRQDGSIPESFDEQAELVWHRIGLALAEAGLGYQHICRVVTYLVDPADAPAHARVRARHLGTARPASTGIVVPRLFNAAYKLEVEVTAAWLPTASTAVPVAR
ncbi:RidA family protein [Hydrogenophaga sp. BPS33]|uniref:RidA family protein n=1 Tax=Hydrogenophaga sp. BPS33 TaxID=2651974 RepID=UPI00131FB8D2|nr:Rid family hydrolase [Hydrogenophaga sp. BPS33]QHE84481.1 hypothetical protein F9K07_06055 [Hydrogenophaga sp. BPS33]